MILDKRIVVDPRQRSCLGFSIKNASEKPATPVSRQYVFIVKKKQGASRLDSFFR
jgi:hypothetical protein